MKVSHERFQNRSDNAGVVSAETSLSDEFRLALLYKKDTEIMKEVALLEHTLRIKEQTKREEAEQRLGQEVIAHDHTRRGGDRYQRIAESLGAVKTDREDVLDTYGASQHGYSSLVFWGGPRAERP